MQTIIKKQIVFTTISIVALVFGPIAIQAQTSGSTGIVLNDVISIDSGAALGNAVDFEYRTAQDYNTAKSKTIENNLVVTSSKYFDVKVKANGNNFVNGSNVIPVNILKIKAVGGGTMVGLFNEITLSTKDQKLVWVAIQGAEKSLNIQYSISAENAARVLLGKPAGTYSQTVTYSTTTL